MTAINLTFSIPEKLALVKIICTVIEADRVVHKKEIKFMTALTQRLNFNINFIEQAQTMDMYESLHILSQMDFDKKEAVGDVLQEAANSDGLMHEEEMALLLSIFLKIGIG